MKSIVRVAWLLFLPFVSNAQEKYIDTMNLGSSDMAIDKPKSHGGEIKVFSKEGEGSDFTVQLPGAGDAT